jgi:hypothetical protein
MIIAAGAVYAVSFYRGRNKKKHKQKNKKEKQQREETKK